MNLFVGIIFWYIGLKLQMDTSYYVIIVMGMIVQFLIGMAKSNREGANGSYDGEN